MGPYHGTRVRVTHLPTGVQAEAVDRTMHRAKAKAVDRTMHRAKAKAVGGARFVRMRGGPRRIALDRAREGEGCSTSGGGSA